jgi:hypothetical protein
MAVAELHFLPEPSALLLLAAGMGGLVTLLRFSKRDG